MLRLLAIAASALHVVAPRRIVDAAERLAFENPGAGRLRPWTLPVARLEGLAVGALVARRGGFPRPLTAALALLGFLLAAVPRRMLAFGLGIAYENPGELEVKSWVVPAARLVGVLYVVLGLFPGRADAPTDARRDEQFSRGRPSEQG